MFSSLTFIYIFLPLVLLFFYITPEKYRRIILLIFSLIFYSSEKSSFVFLMILCIIISYFFGILIEKFNNKIIFFLSLIVIISPLIYFKYTNFLIENINKIISSDMKRINVIMPIGISFYTFQIISYLADIKMKRINAEKNIINLACYITFFPQLVAGPIVTYSSIKNQILKIKNTYDKFSEGIFLFLIGLGKKILIANQLGEICNLYKGQSIIFTWFYVISYTLQIYFDFSGYSDMAIGLGKMFGINLPSNFNYPLCAISIKDFWKRWHITLSSFFKNYVYIPLGGSRRKTIRNIINLSIVWLLTGLWHGASWNFVLWGLYFLVFLLLEKYIDVPNVVKKMLTPIIIIFSFIIFGNDNFVLIFKNLFIGDIIDDYSLFYIKDYLFLFFISIIGATPIVKNIVFKLLEKVIEKSKIVECIIKLVFIIIMMIICSAYLVDSSYNPFLYFRF